MKLVYLAQIEVTEPPRFTLVSRIVDHEAAGLPDRETLRDLAMRMIESNLSDTIDQFGVDDLGGPVRPRGGDGIGDDARRRPTDRERR